ncbi:MAG: peptide chain release factor 1 [Verrucomicrobia bacterium]|nr:peptide chain release factor 1 [Verrucomicrobiota bacterium]MDA1085833.1 peptide chain release factor 1 [Verrucomicrobiota bacterium]
MIEESRLNSLREKLADAEGQIADPSVLADQKNFRRLSREYASLRRRVEKADAYSRIRNEIEANRSLLADHAVDEDIAELAREELAVLEETLPKVEQDLMLALIPVDPNDSRNAIMEIRAGTGGDEAALFAGDLFRMYSRYAEQKGWKVGVIDASASDIGGYKEIVFTVEGEDAFLNLKFEMGGHRVQRVPRTESQGRIHTSAATVAVFAEAEAEDELDIPPDELRVDTFCASGPGGQSVNTTYSAIRVTHLPTGLVAQSQDERSQQRNRQKAMAVLYARLLDFRRCEEEAKMGAERRSQIGSGDRSERSRTYNFPQNRLTDHRINLTVYSLDRVMEGQLNDIIAGLRAHDVEAKLSAIGAE